MTIYTHENCARNTSVVNMDSGELLKHAWHIDTAKGDVTSYVWPLTNDAASVTQRFRSIYAITDGRGKPVLFHCYGLLTPTPI